MVGRIITAPPSPHNPHKCLHPIRWKFTNVLLYMAKQCCKWSKLRILRWRDYQGYPGGPNIITRLFICQKQESEKKK